LLLGAVAAGATRAAPTWAAEVGPGFWAFRDGPERLREAEALEMERERQTDGARGRVEAAGQVATRLADGQVGTTVAVNEVLATAFAVPDWFDLVRGQYLLHRVAEEGATDRDVAAHYLLLTIDSLRESAERLGDAARADYLSARLAVLKDEFRLPNPGTSPHTAVR
jgi:hypothetical protein